jgi:hypothetical protein
MTIMPRKRFTAPALYDVVSYAQNQVVELSDDDVRALGDSLEDADDRDVEKEARDAAANEADPDARTELANITHREGDAQDVPDALRDEEANRANRQRQAKVIGSAPRNKMVREPQTKQ